MKNKISMLRGSSLLSELGITLLSILLAFAISALIVWAAGFSVSAVFINLWKGAFGGRLALGATLTKSTPIILTSLSFLIAFRAGLFNIGAEGQLYVGALVAAVVGAYVHLPVGLHVFVCLLAAAAAGALWGWIPGYLKAKRGVNEFVSTMMLSYVAIGLTDYLVAPRGPLHDSKYWANQTMRVASSAALPRIMKPTQVSIALVIAIALALIVWYYLFRTPAGYELRSVGLSPTAAEYGGIQVEHKIILALTLGGLLAGLAGAGEVLGTHSRFIARFSPGYGWDGIAGALIARAHPIGAIFASLLIGALRAGGMQVQRSGAAPGDITSVIQGLVIFFIIAPTLIRSLIHWRRR